MSVFMRTVSRSSLRIGELRNFGVCIDFEERASLV